jgi:hypothetical protein
MPSAEYTEGSELVLDEETVALAAGWTEPAKGSNITRIGSLVVLSMQVKNEAEPAWVEATVYAAKALVSEGGKVYESLAAGNEKHKPSSDAGVHWKEVIATPTVVATLPEQYWPAAAMESNDGKFTLSTEGVLKTSVALTSSPASYIPVQLSYRAAILTP